MASKIIQISFSFCFILWSDHQVLIFNQAFQHGSLDKVRTQGRIQGGGGKGAAAPHRFNNLNKKGEKIRRKGETDSITVEKDQWIYKSRMRNISYFIDEFGMARFVNLSVHVCTPERFVEKNIENFIL